MTFVTNTLTGTNFATDITTMTGMTPDNTLVIRAIDYMLRIYQKTERRWYPHRYRAFTVNTQITSAGLDLQVLMPTMISDTEHLKVYSRGADATITNMDQAAEIPRVDPGDKYTMGYYISGDGKLYISPSMDATTTLYIMLEYQATAANYTSIGTVVPIDRDAQGLCLNFILDKFFSRRGLLAEAQDAEAKFIDGLNDFFAPPPRAVFL